MPRILNFRSNNGPFSIELLDNRFVDFWFDHFTKMIGRYSIYNRNGAWPYYKRVPDGADIVVNGILSAIEQINQLDCVCPLPDIVTKEQLLKLDLTTQQILNRLHRYAVVGTEIRDRWTRESKQFNWIDWNNERYMYLLNLLNQNIHHFEEFVETPHKKQFRLAWNTVEILFDASRYNDVDVYQDDADVAIPKEFEEYLALSGYDVWIKKDLLGKDFITAFADHDDPTEFDIRPPPMISGAIQIDINYGKDTIYQSAEFANWLGCIPGNQHGNYPLGNIVSGKENLKDCTEVHLVP